MPRFDSNDVNFLYIYIYKGTDWNSNEANSGRNLNPDIVLNASANTSAVYALECLV